MCDSSCGGSEGFDQEDEFDEEFARAMIPAALELLDWQRMTPDTVWRDGERLLVAVAVRTGPTGDEWMYKFYVVDIHCDEDGIEVLVDGDMWGWSLDDVDWYVRLDAYYDPLKIAEDSVTGNVVQREASGFSVRVLAPCGHELADSKCVGVLNSQNNWECELCGERYSR